MAAGVAADSGLEWCPLWAEVGLGPGHRRCAIWALIQEQLIDDMDVARINEHKSAPKQMSALLDILLNPFRFYVVKSFILRLK